MTVYHHTQKAKYTFALVCVIVAIDLACALFIGDADIWVPLVVVALILLPLGWIFSSLTVELDGETLSWHFRSGFWKKQIPLADIDDARRVRTHWSNGLGIRFTRNGWLYNVAGRNAVAVKQRNGTIVIIGTDEPERLVEALDF